MTSIAPLSAALPATASSRTTTPFLSSFPALPKRTPLLIGFTKNESKRKRALTIVSAVGEVSEAGTTYLIAGAAAVALIGTAFPILFSRKDLCPECDGAGFVRKSGATLQANAARKDLPQIVCARCNGLGKLGQVDK